MGGFNEEVDYNSDHSDLDGCPDLPGLSAQKLTGWGLKAGLNLSNLTDSDADLVLPGATKKMRTGFTGGGFFIYGINEMFEIQPEVLYSMRGARYELTFDILGQSYTTKTSLKLDYLEMFIPLKIGPPMTGNISPSLLIGPNIALLLSAKQKTEAEGVPSTEIDVEPGYRNGDIGFTVRGEIGMKMGMGTPFIGARYTMGLLKIMAGTGGALPEVKNGVIGIMAGIRFM